MAAAISRAGCERSKTIAYRKDLCPHLCCTRNGEMVDEFVFLEHRPDGGTSAIFEKAQEALESCRKADATLLLLDFSGRRTGSTRAAEHHRSHFPLTRWLSELNSYVPKIIWLPPDAIMIDGYLFDPIKHFKNWHIVRSNLPRRPQIRHDFIQKIIDVVGVDILQDHNFAKASAILSDAGIKTINGEKWERDNLRNYLRSNQAFIEEHFDVRIFIKSGD
jgi:hypothetical protein